jgi:hypothetical protein
MPDQYEILDPLPGRPRMSKWRKYGPAIFLGAMVAMPAMNLGSSYFEYKTAKLELEITKIKAGLEHA